MAHSWDFDIENLWILNYARLLSLIIFWSRITFQITFYLKFLYPYINLWWSWRLPTFKRELSFEHLLLRALLHRICMEVSLMPIQQRTTTTFMAGLKHGMAAIVSPRIENRLSRMLIEVLKYACFSLPQKFAFALKLLQRAALRFRNIA